MGSADILPALYKCPAPYFEGDSSSTLRSSPCLGSSAHTNQNSPRPPVSPTLKALRLPWLTEEFAVPAMARAAGRERRLLAIYTGGTIGMRSEGGGESAYPRPRQSGLRAWPPGAPRLSCGVGGGGRGMTLPPVVECLSEVLWKG